MFNSIKKALGFGHKEYTDFEDSALPDVISVELPADTPGLEDLNLECASELLDSILGVINANLPPLVSESIDSERQRLKLTKLLGPALVNFANKLKTEAERSLTSDREKMKSELEDLRTQKKDFNSKREAQKADLLSEQRQRRALTDRNRELDAKIDELQSEIEQHKLTISSLMNKIRVSEVNDSEVEDIKSDYEQQLQSLKVKIKTLETENEEQAAKIAELEVPQALDDALEQRKELVESVNPADSKPKKARKPRRKPESTVQSEVAEQLDELEMVNFLLPGGVPAGHVAAEPNPDFGYQPPKPSPEPNPDIQLTLF